MQAHVSLLRPAAAGWQPAHACLLLLHTPWTLQDLAKNSSTVVHKERNVHLSGAKFCKKQQALFVAGTLSGKAYIYYMQHTTGAAGPTFSLGKREVLDLNLPGKSYINDVAVSQDRVYFTDSFNPVLYSVPRLLGATGPGTQQRFSLNPKGGGSAPRPITKVKTGAHFDTKAGQFRANGIAMYKSNDQKDILLVANTHTGHLYKVTVDKTAEPVADDAPTSAGAQQAVAVIAQQATMAVASRLRLGRNVADSSSTTEGSPAGLAAAAAAAAAAALAPDVETPQFIEEPTQPAATPVVAGSGTPAQLAQPPQHAKAKGAKALSQNKAAGAFKPKASAKAKAAGHSKPLETPPVAAGVAAVKAAKPKHKAGPQQGRKAAPAAAAAVEAVAQPAVPVASAANSMSIENAAAAAAVQAVHVGSYLTKLAQDVRARMRRPGKQQQQQQDEEPFVHIATGASSSSGVQGVPPQRGRFTALPSADAIVKSGKGTKHSESGTSHQQGSEALLLAEPVKIQEPVIDRNSAVLTAAATQAAIASVAAQQQSRLGRMLLAAADADSTRRNWPTQMARGIAEKLGFSARHKLLTADVQELQLPSIPGQYTKRLLLDGITVKDDTAYVADNYNDRVWGLQLGKGLTDVKVVCVLQGPAMHVPTTLTMLGGRLWWVNAHLDTCFPFLPCPAHKFELHGVSPSMCQPWTG